VLRLGLRSGAGGEPVEEGLSESSRDGCDGDHGEGAGDATLDLEQALAISRDHGNQLVQASTLSTLGTCAG
jgi:hypothetical protein